MPAIILPDGLRHELPGLGKLFARWAVADLKKKKARVEPGQGGQKPQTEKEIKIQ